MKKLKKIQPEKIMELIEEKKPMISKKIEDVIPKNSDKNSGGFFNYLNKPIWYHMGTGGKKLRPALCMISCELLGEDPEKSLNFAVATEIMHNYFLVHDDFMDGDKYRRDKPAVWVKFGEANAINVGDYMSAKAYELILNSDLDEKTRQELLRIYTKTLIKTGEGQALDVNLRADEDFTIEKYLELVKLKTGYYLVCPIVGGAIIAGSDGKVEEKLWELGKNMGAAFQIRDDIIDLTRGKGRAGETGNDIKEGKPGILYAHALREASEEERKKLVNIMAKNRNKTTKEDVKWVRGLYDKYGTIEYAQKMADDLTNEGIKILDKLPFNDKQMLKSIAHFIAERKK